MTDSAAFVFGPFTASAGLLSFLSLTGCLAMDVQARLPELLVISVLCALVELVPIGKAEANRRSLDVIYME